MEELFNKEVTVSIRKAEREERSQTIGICILMNVSNTPVHKKDLVIRLTDETDPFFLYSLTISEEDFQRCASLVSHLSQTFACSEQTCQPLLEENQIDQLLSLKSQQGLLVDFSSFPQKLIDLFELCLTEASKEQPKFCLQLCLSSDNGLLSSSSLQVIETNPFRHLTHISLKLVPASDAYLKKYLAQAILSLKQHNGSLLECLSQTKSDLTAQLAHAEEILNTRSRELERMKNDWSAEITALNNKHSASLNIEKENAIKTRQELQSKLENVKKEQESIYHKRIESLEERLKGLDNTCKDLTDHKYRSEAAIRELKAKLKGTEEELRATREELNKVRRENTSLDTELHQRDKALSQLQTRAAVLEQEIKDKEEVVNRTTQLLESANEQKQGYEVQLEQKQRQVVKLDTAYRQTTQEVSKGNEIIAKLQSDVKGLKSKLKLRNTVTVQQEKVINDKELEIAKLKNETESLRSELKKQREERQGLEKKVGQLEKELEQVKEELKTSENVVTWLNKQVNDQMLTRTRVLPPTSRAGSEPLSIIKGPYSTISSYKPQFSSTPTGSGIGTINTGPSTPTGPREGITPDSRPVLRPVVNHQSEDLRQKVLFRGGPPGQKAVPRVSPLSTSQVSASQMTTPTSLPQNEPFLDPRYLPPEGEPGTTPHNLIKENAPLVSNYLPK